MNEPKLVEIESKSLKRKQCTNIPPRAYDSRFFKFEVFFREGEWSVWSIDVTRVTVGLKLKIEIIERQTESMLAACYGGVWLCMIHHACSVPHICECGVCSAIRFDFRCVLHRTTQTMRRMRWNERIQITKTKTNRNNNNNKTKQSRDSRLNQTHTHTPTHTLTHANVCSNNEMYSIKTRSVRVVTITQWKQQFRLNTKRRTNVCTNEPASERAHDLNERRRESEWVYQWAFKARTAMLTANTYSTRKKSLLKSMDGATHNNNPLLEERRTILKSRSNVLSLCECIVCVTFFIGVKKSVGWDSKQKAESVIWWTWNENIVATAV